MPVQKFFLTLLLVLSFLFLLSSPPAVLAYGEYCLGTQGYNRCTLDGVNWQTCGETEICFCPCDAAGNCATACRSALDNPGDCQTLPDRTWITTFRACMNLQESLNEFVQLALLLVGAAALGRFLIGAFKYVMSSGDPKSLEDARDTLTNAFLGLIIVVSAYLIAQTLTGVFGGQGLPIDFLGFSLGP